MAPRSLRSLSGRYSRGSAPGWRQPVEPRLVTRPRARAPSSHERCAVTPQQVFPIVNLIATAAWLALVILPGRRWVTGLVTSTFVPLLFAIVYVGVVVTTFGRTPGGFSTLE